MVMFDQAAYMFMENQGSGVVRVITTQPAPFEFMFSVNGGMLSPISFSVSND